MNYQAWEECRKSLELELNQDEFSTWISPLAYSEEQDEFGMQAVTLLAPNDFIKEHVKQNYDSIIKQYLSRSLDSENLSLNYDLFNTSITKIISVLYPMDFKNITFKATQFFQKVNKEDRDVGNKHTDPNKIVRMGKILKINKFI